MSQKTYLSRKNGSSIVVVVIFTTALAVGVAAILRHALTERRLNMRSELWLESRNAAESLVEYGFAQLRYKFDNQTNVNANALDPDSADALKLPSTTKLTSNVDSASLELIGGTIPPFPPTLTYIDPNDPNNDFDPLKGKLVRAREISIFGKASVNDAAGRPTITSYVSQRLQVRDTPLFAHAIFYNLDLEISPGPRMDIYGPVHTNGDLYVQGISGLHFHSQVTTAGHLYYGWGTTNTAAQGSGSENLQGGPVNFQTNSGSLVNMKIDGTYYDSQMGSGINSNGQGALSDDWRSFASNRWHGNVQTTDHGISDYQPVAFSEYEPDDPSTPSVYDPVNTGHALIEPMLPSSHPSYDAEVEKQKMSTKAGLRFVWDAETGAMSAYDKDGNTLDISNLSGSGSDNLWEVKPNVMYDHRRNQFIDIVDINVGKLKQLIESPDTGDNNDHIGNYNPASDWNGIVYFETKSTASDAYLAERFNYSGVRLWGGETDVSNQGIPSRGSDPGMTFATNNALYIKGHFNADGTRHQDSSSQHSAVVPESGEVPVALFGDSVTLLSKDWDDSVTSKKPRGTHTEVAAAIVSGLIPSDAFGNDASSGGVHNFPRFLEKLSGRDFFIRGALVSLYESHHDNSPWRIDYYSPPRRKWGFNQLFANGTYPPGTPMLRTYRRVDYKDLSKAEYDTEIAALPW